MNTIVGAGVAKIIVGDATVPRGLAVLEYRTLPVAWQVQRCQSGLSSRPDPSDLGSRARGLLGDDRLCRRWCGGERRR